MVILPDLARVLLLCVFTFAGSVKLLAFRRTARVVATFGFRPPIPELAAVGLPLVELTAAALLALDALARWGAGLCLILLIAFSCAIVFNLFAGRRPTCHCFGDVGAGSINWSHVTRNCVLAACAVVVLLGKDPDPSCVWPNCVGLNASAALIAGFTAALAFALQLSVHAAATVRSAHAAQQIHTGSLIGSAAANFALPSVAGGTVSLSELVARGAPVLLLFSYSGCASCKRLMRRLANSRPPTPPLTIAVLSCGDDVAAALESERPPGAVLLLDRDRRILRSYRGTAVPSAVLVGSDSTILSDLVVGEAAALELLASIGCPTAAP